jgi:hypothetical protein
MTLALRFRAAVICAAQSRMAASISRAHAGGGCAGSIRICSSVLRLWRSANGRTLSRFKSNGVEEFFMRWQELNHGWRGWHGLF